MSASHGRGGEPPASEKAVVNPAGLLIVFGWLLALAAIFSAIDAATNLNELADSFSDESPDIIDYIGSMTGAFQPLALSLLMIGVGGLLRASAIAAMRSGQAG